MLVRDKCPCKALAAVRLAILAPPVEHCSLTLLTCVGYHFVKQFLVRHDLNHAIPSAVNTPTTMRALANMPTMSSIRTSPCTLAATGP